MARNKNQTLGNAKTLEQAESYIIKSKIPFAPADVLAQVLVNLTGAGRENAALIRAAILDYEKAQAKGALRGAAIIEEALA